MKHTDGIDSLFNAMETLCTVSASQPSLPKATNIVIDSAVAEVAKQSNKSKLNCMQCNRKFKTPAQLIQHLTSRHLNIRPFKCNFEFCNASFTLVAHLKAHRRIHSGERPYLCLDCNSSFIQLSHLKTHQKVHTGEKPFMCDICASRFRQQSNLNSHRLIHTGERPYKCDVCSSSFVQVGHLKSHQRIHTNERPYKCKECLSAFRQISNLRNHEKSHQYKKLKAIRSSYKFNNKTKPSKNENCFSCTECDFSCPARYLVLSHFRAFHSDLLAKKKTQNGGNPIFMCSVCSACFDSCDNIKCHMKQHAASKLLHCSFCEETFITGMEMLKHQRQHHTYSPNPSIILGTIDSDYDEPHNIDVTLESSGATNELCPVIASSC